jgi:hypothetical protein
MSYDDNTSRRSVLKKASVAAAISVVGATGSASACDCTTEIKCVEESCYDGQYTYDYTEYSRECCECDNGTSCDDWTKSGCCPFTS